MKNETFLGALAKAYTSRYDDLSEFCFIFPNRRSGTFFLKYLREMLPDRTILAPETMPMGEFMSRVSGHEVAPRVTQLMQLYLAYRDLRKLNRDMDGDENIVDFDEFLPWGEVVLSDISEVDMYDVNAHDIFKNVEDYRKLQTDPLTDEQKELVSRFFGFTPLKSDSDRFWVSFEEGGKSRVKDKFLELWQLLPELYDNVRARLETLEPDLPMCLAGTGYRIAMDKVLAQGPEALPWRHVVAVGLDWMSTAEIKLFRELKKYKDADGNPIIEFFWDLTGPVLTDRENDAGATIRRKMARDNFPQPEWAREFMRLSHRDRLPEITEIGVPGNSMQAKISGMWLERQLKEDLKEELEDARVAVVLPDEALLLPQLYSIPPELDDVNLTMGLSMRYTSTAGFMYHLQRLHQRRQTVGGRPGYLAQDLMTFFALPVVQLIAGSDVIRRINTYLEKSHRRVLSCDEIHTYSETLYNLLRPIPRDTKLAESVSWLQDILLKTDEMLSGAENNAPGMKTRLERMQIQVYLSALYRIAAASSLNNVEMRFNTLFHILSRMVSGEKIRFEGEPLKGLQVMGLLETRALDFDRLIVLSMNDKVMPRHGRRRSFIPDSIRKGYGMPPGNNDEKLYGYWFYRLLSRAGDVTLVYDSRVGEGMRSGGKSRYLMQLEKLYDRDMKKTSFNFHIGNSQDNVAEVEKTPKVREQLRRFLREGDNSLNLSASALQSYLKCPLQFYYRHVLKYSDDPAPANFIDPITQGTIFHNMIVDLYFPDNTRKLLNPPKILTAEMIDAILADDGRLRAMMRRHVNRSFRNAKTDRELDEPLGEATQMVSDRLLEQVKGVLLHDRAHAPVKLLGGEVKFTSRWKVSDNLTVNMTASYDRVDISPEGRKRIVDYKTGSVHLFMQDMDAVFNADYRAGNVFQLLLYAHLLEKQEGAAEDIDMAIFDTNAIQRGEGETHISTDLKGTRPIRSQHAPEVIEFTERLNAAIAEIFDPDTPFRPTCNQQTCDNCVMRNICGR